MKRFTDLKYKNNYFDFVFMHIIQYINITLETLIQILKIISKNRKKISYNCSDIL